MYSRTKSKENQGVRSGGGMETLRILAEVIILMGRSSSLIKKINTVAEEKMSGESPQHTAKKEASLLDGLKESSVIIETIKKAQRHLEDFNKSFHALLQVTESEFSFLNKALKKHLEKQSKKQENKLSNG